MLLIFRLVNRSHTTLLVCYANFQVIMNSENYRSLFHWDESSAMCCHFRRWRLVSMTMIQWIQLVMIPIKMSWMTLIMTRTWKRMFWVILLMSIIRMIRKKIFQSVQSLHLLISHVFSRMTSKWLRSPCFLCLNLLQSSSTIMAKTLAVVLGPGEIGRLDQTEIDLNRTTLKGIVWCRSEEYFCCKINTHLWEAVRILEKCWNTWEENLPPKRKN